jgi:membrane protein DedA with SNARE-associated domain
MINTDSLGVLIDVTIGQVGYYGIFVGMILDGLGFPIPGTLIMPFSGYVVWLGKLHFIAVILTGTLGCFIGSLLQYFGGLYGGRAFVNKYGRHFFIQKKDIERAQAFMEQHGEVAVLISRLVPVMRSYTSFPAGIAKMDVKKFSLYTFTGSFLWCFALTYVGLLLGQNWGNIEKPLVYINLAVLSCVLTILAYLLYKRKSSQMLD